MARYGRVVGSGKSTRI